MLRIDSTTLISLDMYWLKRRYRPPTSLENTMMKMHKLMKDADELHFKYSRKELSAELKKRKTGIKSNHCLSHIDTQVIKTALDIYDEEDAIMVETLCLFSDLDYLKWLLEIRRNPEAFAKFSKQDEVDSRFDTETIEKAILHYYDAKYVQKRKECAFI